MQTDITPLAAAAKTGRVDIVSLLIKSGAEVNGINSLGQTALMCACRAGHKNVVSLLLEKGADPNMKDVGNCTAVMYAVAFHQLDVILLLQEKNYDKAVQKLIESGAFETIKGDVPDLIERETNKNQ